MENHHCVHLIIHGRVQGVGYRAFTKARASSLGLSGWVRNRTDGTVEAIISGAKEKIDEVLVALHDGPLAARVDNIVISECTEAIEQGFKQLPTA
jgi:acylphosphatase